LKKKDYNYAITDSPPLSIIQQLIYGYQEDGFKDQKNILPKIFDQETTQARMLSIVDYEKVD
jgi:hypothetical protein